MKVAIIGAGFTGLSAGYYLAKKGHRVSIFEKEKFPGGLAAGYKKQNWTWPLEQHYHHLFESDSEIIKFANELGIKINFYKSKTSILTQNGIFPLDSLISLLKFPCLGLNAKIRMGLTLGYLKLTPFWRLLEKETAKSFILKAMGPTPWKFIWEPLLEGKFGEYADKIPASWFWARIKKRSVCLGHPEGGFETLAKRAVSAVEKTGGKVLYRQSVSSPGKLSDQFDRVISTVPVRKVPYLGSVDLVLRLKKPFLPDNIYWLNIGIQGFSFLSVVEHTNLISKQNYGNEHLVYIGKYLPSNHRYFSLTKEEILRRHHPDLTKINPDYKSSLLGFDVFKSLYAQPVFPLNYSWQIPPFKTEAENIYSAAMEQIYPWDRGTNYAVALGKKAAELVSRQK